MIEPFPGDGDEGGRMDGYAVLEQNYFVVSYILYIRYYRL